jgi:hypothetical protein
MADSSRATNWKRVSGNHPCPVCKHPDWCSVTEDGKLAACRRVDAGAWRTKTDKAGTPVYLHRLDGTAGGEPAAPLRPPGPGAERAGPDVLHRVYPALLAALPLSKAHRDALRNRGLSDEQIERREYGSLPVRGRAALARELRERFGDALLTVPGFVFKTGVGGRAYLTVAGAPGLLIPVRDTAARVVALQVRRGDTGDCSRYSYLSSTKHGGPGSGTPVHVPVGTPATAETVRVTEGALKADVAAALSALPTVGAAGAANWPPALNALKALGCKTARLAFDADAWDKPAVARALAACAEGLAAAGMAVELERWPAADGKGIDDLLANGRTPEVLTGVAARAAIAEALAAATAGEPPPPPSELDRLDAVLADGGAMALFRDGELLRALARLAENSAAEFSCRRAQLQGAGVGLRELDRALTPLRQAIRRERPPLDVAGCYRVSGGRIVREVLTKDGPVEVPLTNWSARIVEQTVQDDGVERHATFAIEGALADGTQLPRADIAADQFPWMRWPVELWGPRAVVLAGASTADHVRVALQLLSGDVPQRTVFAHLGWREIRGSWHYLHACGAIGPDGVVAGVEVATPEPLARFVLPAPPREDSLVAAVRTSLALLEGPVPARIAYPLLAAVYRAALGETAGPVDFTLHLAGPHGAGKTELAALAQQHFGAGLDARHLPGGWSSTANALEGLAFAAKDALFVVDDYAPRGATGDRQRLERDADRLLRSQGNRAGRQRMRADGSLRPHRPPRGLILSTGEDVPPGQSLRGRMLVLEVAPGDFKVPALTPHQQAAAAGRYAEALAGFVRWLARQYEQLCQQLPAERARLREQALTSAGSTRTPGILADLALGMKLFFEFAVSVGAITDETRHELARRCWATLVEAATAQAEQVQAAEPTALFLRLLAGAIGTTANVAGLDGVEPRSHPEAWGWYLRTYGVGENERTDWYAHGHRIGWVDGNDLYLEPEASYAAAQELARRQGDALPVSPRTLCRRLHERGLLLSVEAHGGKMRYAVRRTLEGRRRDVLHLRADALSPSGSAPSAPTDPNASQQQDLKGRTPPDECAVGALEPPDECANGALEPPECATVSPSGNGRSAEVAHLAHSDTGEGDTLPAVTPFCPTAADGRAARPALGAPKPPPGAQLIFHDGERRPCHPADCQFWTWLGAECWYDANQWPPPM